MHICNPLDIQSLPSYLDREMSNQKYKMDFFFKVQNLPTFDEFLKKKYKICVHSSTTTSKKETFINRNYLKVPVDTMK